MWDERWCVCLCACKKFGFGKMDVITKSVHRRFFVLFCFHWLKSTAEEQFPDKVLGFQGWCQVCRSLISSMLYIKGPKFLPAVTGKLGNKKPPRCSPYAPIFRQAWTCTSISPNSWESLYLCSLSALVQKELNNKSWCTIQLEFKDKGTFGGCLGLVWLPKLIALLLMWYRCIRTSAEQLPGRFYIMGTSRSCLLSTFVLCLLFFIYFLFF